MFCGKLFSFFRKYFTPRLCLPVDFPGKPEAYGHNPLNVQTLDHAICPAGHPSWLEQKCPNGGPNNSQKKPEVHLEQKRGELIDGKETQQDHEGIRNSCAMALLTAGTLFTRT